MAFSSIKIKPCKCSDSCTKTVSFGFDGYYYAHAPENIKERQGLKAKKGYQNKLNKAKVSNLSRKLHVAANDTKNEKYTSHEPVINAGSTKNVLMGVADKVFGDWIKNRDKFQYFDEVQEKEVDAVKCPCCNGTFNLDAKDDNGDTVVNAMHFINRTVYSLRYDERNVWSGCCYCNSKQHQNPTGKQYQKFKDFLTLKLGIGVVWQMGGARRNINKLSEGDLRDIIEKYKPKK